MRHELSHPEFLCALDQLKTGDESEAFSCREFTSRSREVCARHEVSPCEFGVIVQDSPEVLELRPTYVILLMLALNGNALAAWPLYFLCQNVDAAVMAASNELNIVSAS